MSFLTNVILGRGEKNEFVEIGIICICCFIHVFQVREVLLFYVGYKRAG